MHSSVLHSKVKYFVNNIICGLNLILIFFTNSLKWIEVDQNGLN